MFLHKNIMSSPNKYLTVPDLIHLISHIFLKEGLVVRREESL